MPSRPSYLSPDLLDVASRARGQQQLDDAVSGLRAPSLLEDAVSGIHDIYNRAAQTFTPLPIVVSDRPDAMQIGQQQERARPITSAPQPMPSGPPPTPKTPTVPTFSAEDFTHKDGQSEYTPRTSENPTAKSVEPARQAAASETPTGQSSGGSHPEKQAIAYQEARASGLDDEGARILVAVTETEGGLEGAIGDNGQSRGGYQFFEGGQMPGFRAWLRRQGIQGDPNELVNDIRLTTRYAATTYLGQAIAAGRAERLSGADLATYVQRHGQVSENPERTGQNYTRLYGGTSPTAGAGAANPAPAASPSAPPAAGGSSGMYTVRDQWGNTFTMSPEAFRKRPGGTTDLTVLSTPQEGAQGDSLRMALTGGQGDMMQRAALDEPSGLPQDEPSGNPFTNEAPGSGIPYLGVSERDGMDYQTGRSLGESEFMPGGALELLPVRPPGRIPEQGAGRPVPAPGPFPNVGTSKAAPDAQQEIDRNLERQMYRQPLDDQQPYNPDDGPRESGYSLPVQPATYGDAGDESQVPYTPSSTSNDVRPTNGPPLSEAGPEQPTQPESPFKPLYDAGGAIVGYVQGAAQDIGNTVATEGIATPIGRGIANAVTRPLLGKPPLEDSGQPETTIDRAIVETGRSLGRNIGAAQSGVAEGDYGEAAMGALGVVGDLAPSTTLARQLNEMTPHGNFPIVGEVGLGDAIMTAALVRDAARLGYGAIKVGGSTLRSIAMAVQDGVPAQAFGRWLAANENRVAAADRAMATEGSVAAPGALGQIPEQFGTPYPPIKGRIGDFEQGALGEASAEMIRDSRMPREAVHPDLRAAGIGPEITPQVDVSSRLNATAGTVPVDVPVDRLGAVNRVLGQGVASAVSGGVSAAVNQEANPDDPYAGVKGFAVGAVAPYAITRGVRAGLRAAGKGVESADGALATLGNVPPSQINQAGNLPPNVAPAVQGAVSAAQRRAANMTAKGLSRPSAWDWLKQAGYAGIYGPATLVNSAVGGAQELVLGQPKEAIRALVEGRPIATRASARAQISAAGEGLTNLGRVLIGDAGGAAAASGGSQGTAGLSERIVNPAGHLAARALERPGEILTEAPDAVFRPLFRSQGMEREASRVAAEIGIPRAQRGAYAEQLVQDAEAVRAGQPATSPEAQRVLDAGEKYADDLGYKGKPGAFGQWLGNAAKRDDAVGVIASFLVPFPSMAARMTTAAARSTPGIGLLPAVRRGQPTKFDVVYDQAFGSVVASGIAYWAFNGGITGSGPDDKEKRQMMIDQGWQPNSTLVGGHYIPNRVFQRFQPMLDTAGEIHDALAYGKKDRAAPELAADLVKRGSRIATDQTGLSGLADLHDMLEGGFASQFPGWAARSAARYVPYAGIIRAAATSLDTKQRKPDRWSGQTPLGEAIGQNLEMAVPGLRQNVPAAQRALGEDAPNPQQGFGAIIPRTTTQRDDPFVQAFQGAGVDIGGPPSDIGGVPLTPAQQRRYRVVMGTELQRIAGPTVGAPNWKTVPPNVQKTLLETFQSAARTLAETAVTTEGGKVFSDARTKAIVDKALGR